MNRRGFLKTLGLAAPAVILTPGLLMPIRRLLSVPAINFTQSGTGAISKTAQDALRHADYVLYGDGITDDSAALQALIDGKNVAFGDQVLSASEGRVLIPSAAFLVSRTLNFVAGQSLHVSNATFRAKGDIGYVLNFERNCTGAISNCTFDTKARFM